MSIEKTETQYPSDTKAVDGAAVLSDRPSEKEILFQMASANLETYGIECIKREMEFAISREDYEVADAYKKAIEAVG